MNFKGVIDRISSFNTNMPSVVSLVSTHIHKNQFGRNDSISFSVPLSIDADYIGILYAGHKDKIRKKMIQCKNMSLAYVIGNQFDSEDLTSSIVLYGRDEKGSIFVWKNFDSILESSLVEKVVSSALITYGKCDDTSLIGSIVDAFNNPSLIVKG